jgi:prepilin-type N-terminal cleavage/methylation domain-containing protein
MKYSMKNTAHNSRQAMTIIELLVVVSILAIISAILVPQLRIANEDRNLREAGRIVGSLFAQASQRAVNDGEAGILIERNPNIVDAGADATFGTADDVLYAGTTLFVCRKVPNFRGDNAADEAERVRLNRVAYPNPPTLAPNTQVFIPLPLEQGEATANTDDDLVRINDVIAFNSSQAKFIITQVNTRVDPGDGITKLHLNIKATSTFLAGSVPTGQIEPQDIGGGTIVSRQPIGSFKIFRQPRRLESSRVDLPDGYIIDLRGSGELFSDPVVNALDPDNPPAFPRPFFYENNITAPVRIFYNARGGIDRHTYGGDIDNRPNAPDFLTFQNLSRLPIGQQYFLVRKFGVHEGDEDATNLFSDPASVWVTVDNHVGTANVVYSSEVTPGSSLAQQISDARAIAEGGQSARQ